MPKRAEQPTIDDVYFSAVLAKPVHPIYHTLEPFLPKQGLALELGCGVGNGALWLADKGLNVIAIDASAEAVDILKGRLQDRTNITVKTATMEKMPFPKADVVVAAFCLFMLSPEDFAKVWRKIKRALKPGGIFMGELLGPNDEWASNSLTHSRQEVSRLLRGMERIHFEEVERDGKTVQGDLKHWHVFHLIARKPAKQESNR
ncbi:MAG: class I SAM-dependent methyltransferase [Fimbriimonadaceae bacterium]|nr:class I SAM-dependent methyltransferase [Fimbriimonadaceae bacterium]